MPTTQLLSLELRAKLFHGFADLSRLSILEALRAGALCVSEIVDATGLTQSNVSNHLRCLRDCELVTAEQDGRYVYYRLSDPRIAHLLDLTDEVLADVARGVAACPRYRVEEQEDGPVTNR